MKSSFCIDLQRFMLIPTKFPLSRHYVIKDFDVTNNKNKSKVPWLEPCFVLSCIEQEDACSIVAYTF